MEESAPGVFEMLKIGIGPSSSHTLGPWRAAERFVAELGAAGLLSQVSYVRVHLYGSLALTGTGHGTDIAVMLGLSGADPVTVALEDVAREPQRIRESGALRLAGAHSIPFDPESDIEYHRQERLPDHANGMRFQAWGSDSALLLERTAYSIGGGFVVWDDRTPDDHRASRTAQPADAAHDYPRATAPPHDLSSGESLLAACRREGCSIAEIARANERTSRDDTEIDRRLGEIWRVMRDAVHRGCRTPGTLPGGLEVTRRAPALAARLTEMAVPDDPEQWLAALANSPDDFSRVLKLVGCFSMAVNEENASFGRIVTAPTNGSAGVIPAVLLYYRYFSSRTEGSAEPHPPGAPREVIDFLLVAGIIGGIFKSGATISAAMGGCQAEIGVSSAMAAAALAEGLGGTPEQAVMAAEIAMEHHLGLTCDPIGGLVQIPCIERNSMGAIKAITAAHIALESDSTLAKVSLDEVVRTMWSTAQDMNDRYKETSLGGLAANVSVRVPEC